MISDLLSAFRRWLRPYLRRWQSSGSFGVRGEHAAERYLRRKGYVIVGRRIRSTLGELDLVAVDHKTVVFVEVKARRTSKEGHPAEAVTAQKQARITRAALMYIKRNHLTECPARFDVIAVIWPDRRKKPTIQHYVNAFEPTGHYELF